MRRRSSSTCINHSEINYFSKSCTKTFTRAIINLSSAIGAQANTLSDRELDSRDERKKQLVEAMHVFDANRLKKVMAAEIALTLFVVSFLARALRQTECLEFCFIC